MRRTRFPAAGLLAAVCLALATLSPTPAHAAPPTPPDAEAGAAWIARQLHATGDVVVDGGVTEWGVTIDALLGLISTGVQADQIAATSAKLYASGEAYIGAAADVANSWPRVAKVSLALQAAGLDPTRFPDGSTTRDLIAELRAVVGADGSLGAAGVDSIFNHPLAMLVFARTTAGVPASTVTWILDQQCSDATAAGYGSFGWAPDCSAPDTDSTALVVQALVAAKADDAAIARAVAWLKTQQAASGGFDSWGAVNTNTSGLVAQTLGDIDPAAALRAAQFIGTMQLGCDSPDVGAIAYDAAGRQAAGSAALAGLTPQFLRASAQAVMGLGGPSLAELSARDAVNRPAPACQVVAPTTPSQPAVPEVATGGAAAPGALALVPLALLLVVAGAVAASRSRALR